MQDNSSPEGWGWTEELNSWKPAWMTISEAARAFSELIKCGYKSNWGCTICKCVKARLPCTDVVAKSNSNTVKFLLLKVTNIRFKKICPGRHNFLVSYRPLKDLELLSRTHNLY